jgi:aspartyl-tRNA(Asn)/glutamyl-tRNA(Gln) amidotransferase subunit A
MTIASARAALDSGQFTAVELLDAYLKHIALVEPHVAGYLTVTQDVALEHAKDADRRIRDGDTGPLVGIPMALKDVLVTAGIRSTAGSKMLEHFVPPFDGTVVSKLYNAGAVLLGKTNCDEFAMGSSNENSAFGPVHNPWDLERVPGGSSGGSAAVVAAYEATFSLGTDTGGSIRQPAAFCGVVGLKPTYGRVSRYGLIAFASSLDQIGPFTQTIADAATVLEIIAGHDLCDSTSSTEPVPQYVDWLEKGVRGLRVGVPREYFVTGIDKEVEASVNLAIRLLETLGAHIEDVSLPSTEHALATYYIIAPAEASANLARFDGVKYGFRANAGSMWDTYAQTRQRGFGPEVKRRIMLGTYALSSGYYDAYYLQAQKVRTLVRQDFDRAFERCQVLIAPTTPTPPFRIGEKVNDPLAMYLSDALTIPVNMAGLPGISMPYGYTGSGLPLAVQLIGPAFGEPLLFQVGQALEQSAERRSPSFSF